MMTGLKHQLPTPNQTQRKIVTLKACEIFAKGSVPFEKSGGVDHQSQRLKQQS